MRLFRAPHARRGLRASAILVIASSLIGASLALAQAPASRVGHMPMGRRATTASAGTVVRLHQRLVHVSIVNFAFRPARLVVSPGTRIVWTNKDSDPHTATSAQGLWASDALDTDELFARIFNKVGTYTYYCSIHPFMHGAIVVQKDAVRHQHTAREVSR